MLKTSKRSLRRHHRERLIARTIDILERWKYISSTDKDLTFRALKQYNNMTQCSCYMCCNVRNKKHACSAKEHLTLQERKLLDSYDDQIEEYYGDEDE